MTEMRIKRRKSFDNLPFIRVVFCFLCIAGTLLVICIFTEAKLFTLKHVLIYSLCSLPLCVLYALAVEKIGSVLGGLFTGWTSKKISRREQLIADLAVAKQGKRSGQFEASLKTINSVLTKDPDFPDALYLKAQILWEGFKHPSESKKCLRKIMHILDTGEPLYRWSRNYYDEITKKEKGKHELSLPNDGLKEIE
jgi:hypothetical protein